jgi:5'-nucleotidase
VNTLGKQPGAAARSKQASPEAIRETQPRREFIVGAAAVAATFLLPGALSAAGQGKKTFTILHTNDMHSAFIGLSPASDYTPLTVNDDQTRGGYARLAGLVAQRKALRKGQGPVLVLDAGDYSMGTAFGAATRTIGGELQLMARMGYDATTLGNHEFDYGPEGLGQSIGVARKAGRIPAVLASNCSFAATDPSLAALRSLAKDGVVRRHVVISRGGIRFGLFGVIGKEAAFYANAGAVKITPDIEAAKEVVKFLRETEKVDVVIALSHGGVEKGPDGRWSKGDDVHLAEAVPGIDVVVSGHSHTEMPEPTIVNGRTPVYQTGKEGKNLGEMVISLEGGKLTVESYKLYPIDDSIAGDAGMVAEIEKLKKGVNAAVFASRGYSVDQPLAVIPQDLPNTYADITAGTPLANLVTDAFRAATKADIGFTANGLMRTGLSRGKKGVITVYDVFNVAPLGYGVVDTTAGSALVTAYFTGQEIKNLIDYYLVDNPTHPGEWFPRVSGARYRYDLSRPKYDTVTAVELGDLDRGYKPIDITGTDKTLYSLSTPLMLAVLSVPIPKLSEGKLAFVPKNKDGKPLTTRIEALEMPRANTGYMLAPPAKVDKSSIDTGSGKDAAKEIKEWQAIMDYIRSLPVKAKGELPVIPIDARANEARAIKVG